ncbi:nucleotidyltransferase family protein [Winogradskyella aurantiaca]|uniref:nucleotidyltransferase family protein n=1 Tax=Winogradskyella aurantiaca TaxID=2219558 RepID=UPI000E1E28F5|nr:nucleotidyltransferase family protein [Winogradskyella aurantiaca]
MKDIYVLIGRILSPTYNNVLLSNELIDFSSWEDLVKISSEQLLLPSIFWSLRKKELIDFLPEDLTSFLTEIHDINSNRNTSISAQLNSIAKLFKDNNINYVLLKGAAFITLFPNLDKGIRMIGDIDILIKPDQLDEAVELMKHNGYQTGATFNYEVKNFRHAPRMICPDEIAAVELHSSIINPGKQDILSTKDIFNQKEEFEGFQLPSKDHLIISTILSSQINSHGRYYYSLHMKQIYDIIFYGLPNNSSLITSIIKERLFHFFLTTAAYLFKDFDYLKEYNFYSKHLKWIKLRFIHPRIFGLLLKIKWFFFNIRERITIFLNNSSYRRHVFKNKIFPFFN